MGLFDYVRVSGPQFVCERGHSLVDEDFQSKDFGCTMGTVSIIDGFVSQEEGGYGSAPEKPISMKASIYSSCSKCPAFVQAGTYNLYDAWVEFEVEIVDNIVREVKRLPMETEAEIKAKPWMKDAFGPMSYEEARNMHISHISDLFAFNKNKE